MLNLSILLEDGARNHPGHVAIAFGDERWTYAEVDAEANRVANLLTSLGITPGDRVALACPNTPWFPIVYFGVLKAGAVVVPVNVMLKRTEMAYHLADSGAKAFFCFAGTREEGRAAFAQAESCEHFVLLTAHAGTASSVDGVQTLDGALADISPVFDTVQRQENDPAVILYTSGTTGKPKGALLSHSNLLFSVVTTIRGLDCAPLRDTHLVVLPLFHSFAASVNMNAGFATYSTLVLLPRFSPSDVIRALREHPISYLAGVPTMYWTLLRALTDDTDARVIARLRIAVSAGSALPATVAQEFRKRFGTTILEGYGMSETSPTVTFSPLGAPPRPGSAGLPIWGVEVRLTDENGDTIDGPDKIGEIAVRGPNVMLGYHNRPEATGEVLRDGWLYTGDLARRDEDGWYYVVDRKKDMIIRGGYNVYPREIEDVLMRHEAVSLAVVVGVPDPKYGEEIKAFIVRRPGVSVTEGEIVAWGRQQMAAYKYPRTVTFVNENEIPMTSTGKPRKRDLAASAG